MKAKIISLWENQLIKGTTIFFVGSGIVSLGSFLYHLVLARILGPVEYGVLASLIGLTYLLSIPMGALDMLVTKVVSSFDPKFVVPHTNYFIRYLWSYFLKLCLVTIPIFLIFIPVIMRFLHIDEPWGIVFVGIFVYLGLIGVALRSALKGMLEFLSMISIQVVETYLRLIIAIGLVLWLWHSYLSPLLATVIALLIAIIAMYRKLQPVFSSKVVSFIRHDISLKSVGIGSLILSGTYAAMYSVDILLVKHFFSDFQAGIYAVLATAGKIIFFAVAPIGVSLIPVISRKSKRPWEARGDLLLIIALVTVLSIGVIGAYLLFPDLIISMLFTPKFKDAVPYLPWMGLVMFFYSLANSCSGFLLALGRIKSALIPLCFVIFEVILIIIFHHNISEVITILGVNFGILSMILVGVCLYETQKQRD